MQKEVVLEVRLFGEAAAADMTLEGPRAIVDIHVTFQVTGGREGLGAELALVRLFLKSGNAEFSTCSTFIVIFRKVLCMNGAP